MPLVVRIAVAFITGERVNSLELALRNPPEKPDGWATLVSTLSALGLVVRGFVSEHPNRWDYLTGCFAMGAAFAIVVRYVVAKKKRYPFHELALGYVKALQVHLERGDITPPPEAEADPKPPEKS